MIENDILTENVFEIKLDAFATTMASLKNCPDKDVVSESLRASYLRADLLAHNRALMTKLLELQRNRKYPVTVPEAEMITFCKE